MEEEKPRASNFLTQNKGKTIGVKLSDGSHYKGTFICLDGLMNLVLENCEEIKDEKSVRKLGDVFLRGNNVSYIHSL